MEIWQIVIAAIALLIASVLFSYVNKTRKKQGPILSKVYFSLSDEEKQYFDTDSEYERLTILYGLFASFFVFVALCVITLLPVFGYIAIGVLIVALIYSIAKLIELRMKQ